MESKSCNSNARILHHHKLIEQLLLEAGLISASQIQLAKQEEKSHGMELSEIFVVRGWVKQVTVDFFAQRLAQFKNSLYICTPLRKQRQWLLEKRKGNDHKKHKNKFIDTGKR